MALARFEDFIGGLLKREGGYAANLGGTGEEVNRGITKASYPGMDIKGMSEQQAIDIYRRDYWDKLPMGGLSQRAANIAADASVHSGVGFGRELIEKSGGDPDMMNDLRRQKYEGIMNRDPSKRQFRKNWMGRISSSDPASTEVIQYNAEKPQVQTAQGTVAVDETGQANQGGIENMLAQLEALRPEPMTDMERIGGAIGEGFANQKPYQGMSAAAGFLNAYAAGNRISAREKVANRAYEMKALQMQIEFGKKEKGTSDMQNYKFAQEQGYGGSFMDYQASQTSEIDQLIKMQQLDMQQKKGTQGGISAGWERIESADGGMIDRPRKGSDAYVKSVDGGNRLQDAYTELSSLRELTAKHGTEVRGEVAGQMKSLRRKIMQKLADAWKMGALGDMEYENLKDSIPDPGSATSYLIPNDQMLTQFDVFMDDYMTRLERQGQKFLDWGYADPWGNVYSDEDEKEFRQRKAGEEFE